MMLRALKMKYPRCRWSFISRVDAGSLDLLRGILNISLLHIMYSNQVNNREMLDDHNCLAQQMKKGALHYRHDRRTVVRQSRLSIAQFYEQASPNSAGTRLYRPRVFGLQFQIQNATDHGSPKVIVGHNGYIAEEEAC
jgi:hypothetical protein